MTSKNVVVCDMCQTSVVDDSLPGKYTGSLQLTITPAREKNRDPYSLQSKPTRDKRKHFSWDLCGPCAKKMPKIMIGLLKEGNQIETDEEEW